MANDSRSNPDESGETRAVVDEPPPFLGTWPRVYAGVLVYLAVLIGIFYWFTVAFRP
jgi:hypothetical protein